MRMRWAVGVGVVVAGLMGAAVGHSFTGAIRSAGCSVNERTVQVFPEATTFNDRSPYLILHNAADIWQSVDVSLYLDGGIGAIRLTRSLPPHTRQSVPLIYWVGTQRAFATEVRWVTVGSSAMSSWRPGLTENVLPPSDTFCES